jgi:hypothetical protein
MSEDVVDSEVGEIIRYQDLGNGRRNLGVKWKGTDVYVLVFASTAKTQEEADRVAGVIASTSTALAAMRNTVAGLEDHLERARVASATLRGSVADRDSRIMALLGERPMTTSSHDVAAREESDGSVWVGQVDDPQEKRHGWRGHFAVRFSSWTDLRQTWPHLAPAGLKIDADGRPAVILRSIPVVNP